MARLLKYPPPKTAMLNGAAAELRTPNSDLRNSPSMMGIFHAIWENIHTRGYLQTEYLIAVKEFNNDSRLQWLTGAIGQVAQSVTASRRPRLLHVGSILFVWLQQMGLSTIQVVEAVAVERARQRRLFQEKQISFEVSSCVVCPGRKMRVLVEELGEVAKAIDQLEEVPNAKRRRQELITELVQATAVTVAWLETPEQKP
jgi:hypothetical protein